MPNTATTTVIRHNNHSDLGPIASPVTIVRRRHTLTAAIAATSTTAERRSALLAGWNLDRDRIAAAKVAQVPYRVGRGFMPQARPMLSAPTDNLKLAKGSLPSYGLTLSAHITRLPSGRLANACPSAGQCVAVCVLKRGKGGIDSVIRGREWKTDFVGTDPMNAAVLIGSELRRAVLKHGPIAFRSNVNADVDMFVMFGDALRTLQSVTTYDYTKRKSILFGNDAGTHHVAYSYSETSDADTVTAHVANGGVAAVVTDRQIGDPIFQWHPTLRVVDADKSDLFMLESGVIGDLSFKRDGLAIPTDLAFVQRVGYSQTATSALTIGA